MSDMERWLTAHGIDLTAEQKAFPGRIPAHAPATEADLVAAPDAVATVRSELTWEGTVAPPLKPVGDCIVTEAIDGSLHIDRADPRVLISAELLDQIKDGRAVAAVTLDGDLFRIAGTNRTVVYRIGEKVPDLNLNAYYAEWPD